MQTRTDCMFCKIVSGEAPAHTVWEDERFLAFLSLYPNTEGVTVVIPKAHYPSYAFDLSDEMLCDLILAAKKVGRLLDTNLDDVARTALVLEGYGVDHVHAKLFPMHGTADLAKWERIESDINKYFDRYEGYISSHDHERAQDETLAMLAKKLRGEA